MSKIGKLYELMSYGDDLDAFYSMNKRMTGSIHTENDREIMELLDEAKKEYPTDESIEGTYEPSEYDIIAHAGFSQDVLDQKREEWYKKWFGE